MAPANGAAADPGSVRIEIADPDSLISEPDAHWLLDSVAKVVRAIPACGGLVGGRFGGLSTVGQSDRSLSGEVRVRLVNDAEMSAAHVEYCEIDGTTDVLTFDMSEFEDEHAEASGSSSSVPVLDVDILACVDEASRQAGPRGHTVTHELLLYILHGVLHCLGHDDHDEAAHAAMHAAEDRVLTAAGFGALYAASAEARSPDGAAGGLP